ncbi:hypothetical protein EV426DRAFT_395205 [Tirmania nivea]|nr:hypothetical protein EV426DRAFT_395205 [Tirmania nivea]
MATRTTRYRSHSPTPSPTHAYEQPQPLTTGTVGSMTLETRGSRDNLYGSRNDLTLPPFSRNLVVGNGAPNSPRQSSYPQAYPLSPSQDARNYTRNSRPIQIQENDVATKRHYYIYDDISYSEFSQTIPPVNLQDSESPAHQQLPSIGNSQHTNGSRLPPINHSAYQTNYSANPDAHRQRQLSINSIISSPSVNTPSSTYGSVGTPAHGNGTMKKRKKSFGAEGDGGGESIGKSDRERDGGIVNGDGGGAGMNGSHKVKPNVGLGLGLEDPDVRLAAEALGDLRADPILDTKRSPLSIMPHTCTRVENGVVKVICVLFIAIAS